jgi:DNA-directed RNA polymerase specialized sigma24 family protein
VARELLDAVAGLAPGDREVLIRTAAGYSYSEVAEQAELSVRAVERRLIGARRRLRLELGLRPAEPGPTARPRAARSVAAA